MSPAAASFWVCTLASGSSGNCVYAQCPEGAVLVDAGISARRIAKAVGQVGGALERVAGIVVSHSHIDHIRSAGVLSRRHGIPLLMTRGTYDGGRRVMGLRQRPQLLRAGDAVSVGGFRVHTIATPHDARGSIAVVLERDRLRVGVLSDLGHPFAGLQALLGTLDAVILEANYDPQMLEEGPYPERLKRRIRSPRGHLSNEEAAELVRAHGSDRLQVVLLAHLSENNNEPEVALATVRAHARARLRTSRACLSTAPRHVPSEVITLRRRNSA